MRSPRFGVGRRCQPRVVSVLPSATELLCFIGGEKLLVGRSHEDNYPPSITSLPVVTGQKTTYTTAYDVDRQVANALRNGHSLYTLDVETIHSLRPDVILTQDICSVCAIDLQTVERMAAAMAPPPLVCSLNPESLEGVLENILQLGEAVGMECEAAAARESLLKRLAAVDQAVLNATLSKFVEPGNNKPPLLDRKKVAFIEWPDPLYVGGHWTPQLINRAGATHPLNEAGMGGAGKSFAVDPSDIIAIDPDLIVLAPCGLNLQMTRREHARLASTDWWPSLTAVRAGRVALVDGDAMFNRPGPRLVDALEWLVATLHGVQHLEPLGFPVEWIEPQLIPLAPASEAAQKERVAAELRDIEEAHMSAVRKGQLQYRDPGLLPPVARLSLCASSSCTIAVLRFHCAVHHVRRVPLVARPCPSSLQSG